MLRYLNHEPVEAERPVEDLPCSASSSAAIASAVAIAATLLLALLVGAAGTTTGWVRASQAEADARRERGRRCP